MKVYILCGYVSCDKFQFESGVDTLDAIFGVYSSQDLADNEAKKYTPSEGHSLSVICMTLNAPCEW